MVRKYIKKAVLHFSDNNYETLNVIEVSKDNILHNLSLLEHQHPDFDFVAVIKANAYGHGIRQVAKILNESKCTFLAVDGYFEAARIKEITNHKILVMGYILPANARLLDFKKCSFVVQDIDGLRAFAKMKHPVNIHIELNTGMNRLGLQPEELDEYLNVIKQSPNLTVEGIMTHLADADNADEGYTEMQTRLFDKLVEQILNYGVKPKYIQIAQ